MERQATGDGRVKVAIVGSGNIGSDLMYKLLKAPGHMELKMVAGVDPESEGLKRAKDLGIGTTADGIGPVLEDPEIKIVFDATSKPQLGVWALGEVLLRFFETANLRVAHGAPARSRRDHRTTRGSGLCTFR